MKEAFKQLILEAMREYLMPVLAFVLGILILCAGMGAGAGVALNVFNYLLQ